MNLMHLINSKDKSAKLEKIRKDMVSNKINIIPFDKPTLETPLTTYFLNGVPDIPQERDVVSRWSEYLPIKVNWTPGKDVTEDKLKRQYAFSIIVADSGQNRNVVRNPKIYTIVFNNAETCQKHLKWFNSCFLMTKDLEEEKKKEMLARKREKLTKKLGMENIFEE